ncbi:MAG: hypothetical protein Q4G68_13290 [Planctomycetia bacterium]|nr:hypothetical protein [Planctomycetia bacterium]
MLASSGVDFNELDRLLLRGPLRIGKQAEYTHSDWIAEKNRRTEDFFLTLYHIYHTKQDSPRTSGTTSDTQQEQE